MRFKWINFKKFVIVLGWCIHVNSVIFSNLTTSSKINRKYHDVQMDPNTIKHFFKLIRLNLMIFSTVIT